ncbi:MAG: hypothetical protein EPN93_13630 [Spirochaetes bacterium]|nr:MAG: hypothetical protein EPN93_13630 [Spirochaetota bacterium]
MMRRFTSRLRSQYSSSPFEIRIKSRILAYLCLIIVVILSCIFVSNLIQVPLFGNRPLFIIIIQISFILISLALLLNGFYNSAVKIIMVTVPLATVSFIIMNTIYGTFSLYHVNTLYYSFAILVVAALFGTWQWLYILTGVYIVFATSYFAGISMYADIHGNDLTNVILDYNFSLLLVCMVSAMIKKINASMINRLEFYNEQLHHEMSERVALEKAMMTIDETIHFQIGQELHDDLGQHLVAVKMRSEALRKISETKFPDAIPEIDTIIELTDQAVLKTRRVLKGLGLINLNANNFISALSGLVLEFNETFKLRCEFTYQETILIPDDLVAINMYRIAQESINNAIKHGKADIVRISLTGDDKLITLEITDNGCGMPDSSADSKGMGLRIMKYRANIIGAVIEISNSPGEGVSVRCALNLAGLHR